MPLPLEAVTESKLMGEMDEQGSFVKPEVLLAYRAYTLYLLHRSKQIHEGYVDVLITYQSLDGNDKSIEWYYKNDNTDCARVEAW